MTYEVFKLIPHQRIMSKYRNVEELFDIYACGEFDNQGQKENIELVELQPQMHYSKHYHQHSAAIIYIIAGCGEFLLGTQTIPYQRGRRFAVPAHTNHGFMTKDCTLFLSIQTPPIIDPLTGAIDLHYLNE